MKRLGFLLWIIPIIAAYALLGVCFIFGSIAAWRLVWAG